MGIVSSFVVLKSMNATTGWRALMISSVCAGLGGTIGFSRGRMRTIDTLNRELPSDSMLRKILLEKNIRMDRFEAKESSMEQNGGLAMVPPQVETKETDSWDKLRKAKVVNKPAIKIVLPPSVLDADQVDDVPEDPSTYQSWDQIRRGTAAKEESAHGSWEHL